MALRSFSSKPRRAAINSEQVSALSAFAPSALGEARGGTTRPDVIQSGTPPTAFSNNQRMMPPDPEKASASDRYRYAQELDDVLDSLEPLTILSATIYLMSFDQMDKLKVCDVMLPGSKESNRYETVNDQRMGAVGTSNQCAQCRQLNCAGHYGLITFGDKEKDIWWEVYSPLFIREIVRVLNCVCHSCSGLLELKENIANSGISKFKGWYRLKALDEYSKKIECSRRPVSTTAYLTVVDGTYRMSILSPTGESQVVQGSEKSSDPIALILSGLKQLTEAITGPILAYTDILPAVNLLAGKSIPSIYKKRVSEIKGLGATLAKLNEVQEGNTAIQDLKKVSQDISTTISIGSCGPIAGCSQKREYLPAKVKDSNAIMFKKENGDIDTMPISDVYKVLDCISDEDARLLGFGAKSHPRDFILKGLLVLPLPLRPPRKMGGELHPHPLTIAYDGLASTNSKIRENRNKYAAKGLTPEAKSKLETEFSDLHSELFSKVKALLLGGDIKSSYPDDIVSILSIIQGKQGTVRNAMLGKRGNSCGRAVITADPAIRYGEIGMPMAARIQTVTEEVNAINQDYILKLMQQGEITAVKTKGKPYNVNPRVITRADYSTYKPNLGDTVYRRMRDGDIIIVNRQPTLRRQSMIAFRVRFLPGYTIRLHPNSAQMVKGDFDGDEMNFWLPQSWEARAEAAIIMDSVACSMSSEVVGPMTGLIQDLITSAYFLTYENQTLDEAVFMEVLSQLSELGDLAGFYERLERYNVNPNSGRALFSALLPPDFYYSNGDVLIVDGILVRGAITSRDVGAVPRSIIHQLWFQYGDDKIRHFLTDATWMLAYYITDVRGFTVSYEDCQASPELLRLKDELINELRIRIEMLQSELTGDPLQAEYIEEQIKGLVRSASGKATALTREELSKGNNLGVMSSETGGGGKGKPFNISQMLFALMQQFFKDERMRTTISGGTRCAPTFNPEDKSLEARGFCTSNFAEGLKPDDWWWHQMASRNAIKDIAVSTPQSGHTMRQLEKFLEDLRVLYDGTVRNSVGVVFQFVYGDGGIDANKCVQVSSPYIKDLATFSDPVTVSAKLNIAKGWVPTRALGDDLPAGKVAGGRVVGTRKVWVPKETGGKLGAEHWARLELEKGEAFTRNEIDRVTADISLLNSGEALSTGEVAYLHSLGIEAVSINALQVWANQTNELITRWIRGDILHQGDHERVVTLLRKRSRKQALEASELEDIVNVIGKWESGDLLLRWSEGRVVPISISEKVRELLFSLERGETLKDEDKLYVSNSLLEWQGFKGALASELALDLRTWLNKGEESLLLKRTFTQWREGTTPTQQDASDLQALLSTWEQGKSLVEIEAARMDRLFKRWYDNKQSVSARSKKLAGLSKAEGERIKEMQRILTVWAAERGIPMEKVGEFIRLWSKEHYDSKMITRPRVIEGKEYSSPFEKWARSSLESWARGKAGGDAVRARSVLTSSIDDLLERWKR